jgi:hypothetical protein
MNMINTPKESGITWSNVMRAFVERALGDGATEIVVRFGLPSETGLSSFFEVCDNGDGTDPHVLFAADRADPRLVGCTSWVGGASHTVEVVSQGRGGWRAVRHTCCQVEGVPMYTSVVPHGSAQHAVTQVAAVTGLLLGTVIRVNPVVRKMPTRAQLGSLLREVGPCGAHIKMMFAGNAATIRGSRNA